MTPGNWIALFSAIAAVGLPLGIALIAHIRRDERRETRLEHVEREIGSRDSGMRGTIHDHSNALTWLSGCVWFLASKVGIELPKRDK